MDSSSRRLPVVGAAAEIHRLGAVEPATIVTVEGPVVIVETEAGEQHTFELHRGKGHFYLSGAGSTGPRLVLR